MAKYRVLVTDFAWENLGIETAILETADAEIVNPRGKSESDLIEAASGCDAIMTNWARTTAAVIAAAKDCQIVSRMGIGLDNIDVEFCTDCKIPVTNVPDYCVVEVAEHALALLMGMARKIAYYHLQTTAGGYDLQSGTTLKRICGQTLGIVGLGNIGQQFARLAQGIGMKVIAYNRSQKVIEGVELVTFEELLSRSDYVSLHTPLDETTQCLVGKSEFAQMKNTAFLINTARGGLIDHGALTQCLAQDGIAGAALDVQDPEPPDLSQAPYNDSRVIVTPHAAFVSEESLIDLRSRAATQVADRLSGRWPAHIVNGVIEDGGKAL